VCVVVAAAIAVVVAIVVAVVVVAAAAAAAAAAVVIYGWRTWILRKEESIRTEGGTWDDIRREGRQNTVCFLSWII
jgi:predicted porin